MQPLNRWISGLNNKAEFRKAFREFRDLMKRLKLGNDFVEFVDGEMIHKRSKKVENCTFILRGQWWKENEPDGDPLGLHACMERVMGFQGCDAMLNIEIVYPCATHVQIFVHKKGNPMWKGWRKQKNGR